MTPLYTYVNLNPREDTESINRSPQVTVFPYYQIDSTGDHRITIHGKIDFHIFVVCRLM